ncbi:MAG: enoyl-CoA hydratase-related protein [Acidobacteriota bacterium]|nr:enoyl-CoA hydratase-related protein [Blastocatellia bacterium]MDW8241090.1 enoyl-CoA hydratase-related protein [Acidobacteriota bacterium]
MSYERILYEVKGSLAYITLNRPEKRNALDALMLDELSSAFAQAGNDKEVRVVVLTGAGQDFCSGLDLTALQKIRQASILENLEDATRMVHVLTSMRYLPKPIVALVRGRALAGGCGLATACDLVLASETAQFGYAEVKIGFVPAIVTALLRRNVSEKRAFELVVGGQTIGAHEAERIGLINHVYPDDEFDARAETFLSALDQNSASAMALTKRLLYRIDGMTFELAMQTGAEINTIARMTDDLQQGIQQFLERKKN